jgi:hypothetical protein
MGLFFTILYLLYMLGAPAVWLPFLAQASVQVYLSGLAGVTTLPRLLNGSLLRHTPQVTVFSGLFMVLILSPLLKGWAGGVPEAFLEQVPYFLVLFLVRVNCDTSARRKVLVFALLLLMVTLTLIGTYNYHAHMEDPDNRFVFRQNASEDSGDSADIEETDEANIKWDARLKAQGLLDDPNDFAQAMLVTIALSTLFWGQGKLSNFFLVLAPGAVLLYGIYLTHSRGALVAIVVTLTFVLRRRLKLWGAALIGAIAAAGLVAMRFTGGRQISVSSGSDRLELWAEGLTLFKQSFGLGIGYHNFADEVGMTAHNSILLVGVETGFLGLTLFMALFVICFTQLNRIVHPADGSTPDPVFSHEARSLEAALTAYLATSWFLSRVYHPIPYLLVGLTATLAFQVAERSPDSPLLPSWPVVVRNSVILAPASLAVIYILVHLRAA